jgi:methionine synthase II (cobalamin-independent)
MTRIRTSHVGRLPSPKGWEDMPGRLAGGEITDPALIAEQVIAAIAETVRKQVACSLPSWVCVVMGLIIRT